jgi:hypothetical protein
MLNFGHKPIAKNKRVSMRIPTMSRFGYSKSSGSVFRSRTTVTAQESRVIKFSVTLGQQTLSDAKFNAPLIPIRRLRYFEADFILLRKVSGEQHA